jgi:hypothetical protein
MSEYVWVSNVFQDTPYIYLQTDISVANEEASIQAIDLNSNGKSVPVELCPKKIWLSSDVEDYDRWTSDTLPDLFSARGHWIVSARAADVLRKFDLGGGALYPVTEGIFLEDEVTRIDGDYYCWIFGNIKMGLMPEVSANLRPPAVEGLWYHMPWKLADGDVAVSKDVLGGPDVWLDKMLFQSIFLSRELGDALDAVGLRKAFRLYKARVI